MATPALILVRHGQPAIDPDKPPPEWDLCLNGRGAVAALAAALAPIAPVTLVASLEPKALQTAEIIAGSLGLEVRTDADFGEHRRPSFKFGGDAEFQTRMGAIFAHPNDAVSGDETAEQARKRLATALARYPVRPLVAVTHGTVLSIYLARLLGRDAYELWRSLRTPDAFVLDQDGGLIKRLS